MYFTVMNILVAASLSGALPEVLENALCTTAHLTTACNLKDFFDSLKNVDFGHFLVGFGVWGSLRSIENGCALQID